MKKNEHLVELELVSKLQNGDIEAFDELFSKYGNRLFAFALSYLKSKEESEELVQDVFLKIWENRKGLKKESSFKSYLFTVAYHNMCRLFRKKQIHQKFLDSGMIAKNSTTSLEDQIEYRIALEQIDELIRKLPEKQRVIFIKSRREGMSTQEIAQEMNLAPGTVDNQISAALKFLRKHISVSNFLLLMFFSIFIQ